MQCAALVEIHGPGDILKIIIVGLARRKGTGHGFQFLLFIDLEKTRLCEIRVHTRSDEGGKYDLVVLIDCQRLLLQIHFDPTPVGYPFRRSIHHINDPDIALFHPFAQPDHIPDRFIHFNLVIYLNKLFSGQRFGDHISLITGLSAWRILIENPAEIICGSFIELQPLEGRVIGW